MTDYPDAPPPQGAGGATGGTRRPRPGESGAPISGALAIVLAIVAVVAGFFILRAITSDDDGGDLSSDDLVADDDADGTTTTTLSAAATTTTVPTTTTEPPLVTDGATVLVANANNVNGSAGQMTRALEAVGYTMGEATNASASTGQLQETVLYYDEAIPAAEAVAESVSRSLGGVATISPLSVPAPTESGETGGAGVIVLLGIDKAGKTLEELDPPDAAGDDGTTVSAPEVSGDESTTTVEG